MAANRAVEVTLALTHPVKHVHPRGNTGRVRLENVEQRVADLLIMLMNAGKGWTVGLTVNGWGVGGIERVTSGCGARGGSGGWSVDLMCCEYGEEEPAVKQCATCGTYPASAPSINCLYCGATAGS